MPAMRPGDVLAGRYRLVVLLHERSGGRFWRAWDNVLARYVALHLISVDDDRAPLLQEAAKLSATVADPHLLRVLDTNTLDGTCYVVNEWGEGTSLNNMVADEPLAPLRAAWLVAEAGSMVAAGHRAGVAHGRLVPENVLLDTDGAVKVIGFAVDAALHGLPLDRQSVDLVDLGGLLYAALTGRWAGISDSGVPRAPMEHGRPLRARQVRAGVPRALDAICEDLLTGGGRLASVQQAVDALMGWIGDPTVVAQAEAERMRAGAAAANTREQPAVPDAAATAGAQDPQPAPASDEGPATELVPAVEDPSDHTQAISPGGSSLDDSGDLDWHLPSSERPAPPPPFEEPPERPLFAPDPPEGRLRRLPPATSADAGYWPFAADAGPSSSLPIVEEEPDDPVPGRGWMRIAGAVTAALLVVLLVLFIIDRTGGNDDDNHAGLGGSETPGKVLDGVTAADFDPFGDPQSEHPDEAKLAVDGRPGTAWTTSGYQQDFGPGGLKPGVGLVLDLGSEREVSSVVVTVAGGTTAVELRSSSSRPSSIDGLAVAAKGTSDDDGTVALTPDEPVTGRFLVVWLTSVPTVDGAFRGSISEVEVRG